MFYTNCTAGGVDNITRMNRYKEIEYVAERLDAPEVIVARFREPEKEILNGMDDLEKMLG